MAKQKTSLKFKAEENSLEESKNKRKPEQKVGIASTASPLNDQINSEYVDPPRISQIGDKRFSLAKRQNLVIGLGKLMGNHNVQREIAPLLDQERLSEVSPAESGSKNVQKFAIAAGPSASADWRVVPAAHRPRVNEAITILDDWVANKTRLRNYFRDKAPGGTNATLQNTANNAQIWELINEGNLGLGDMPGSNISYDTLIYRLGKWQIASTLLHELAHNAGIANEKTAEETLEAARAYCPYIMSIAPHQGRAGDEVTIKGISFGPQQSADDKVEFNGVDAGAAVSWTWSHAGGCVVKVRVPAGAASGPICVINNNVRSNEVNFTVLP